MSENSKDNNFQTSIYPDRELYNKAKRIWNIMELQGKDMSLTKFVNNKLENFVEENEELLEKAKMLGLDEVEK